MIISLSQFLNARESCYKCGGTIALEYRSGDEQYFRCKKELGHYHGQLTRKTMDWNDNLYLESEMILINDVHYIVVDYNSLKVQIVNKAEDLVTITVNLTDNHRTNGLLVSRDGLEKLVHKASVVRHFR